MQQAQALEIAHGATDRRLVHEELADQVGGTDALRRVMDGEQDHERVVVELGMDLLKVPDRVRTRPAHEADELIVDAGVGAQFAGRHGVMVGPREESRDVFHTTDRC